MMQPQRPPLELIAFTIFCIAITAFTFAEMFSRALSDRMTPLLGGNPGGSYIFLIYASVVFWRRSFPAKALLNIRWFAFAILLIGVVFGVIDYQRSHGFVNDPSPYVRYDPRRPLFTILLPVAWALVLLSPRITSYLESSTVTDAARSR